MGTFWRHPFLWTFTFTMQQHLRCVTICTHKNAVKTEAKYTSSISYELSISVARTIKRFYLKNMLTATVVGFSGMPSTVREQPRAITPITRVQPIYPTWNITPGWILKNLNGSYLTPGWFIFGNLVVWKFFSIRVVDISRSHRKSTNTKKRGQHQHSMLQSQTRA